MLKFTVQENLYDPRLITVCVEGSEFKKLSPSAHKRLQPISSRVWNGSYHEITISEKHWQNFLAYLKSEKK